MKDKGKNAYKNAEQAIRSHGMVCTKQRLQIYIAIEAMGRLVSAEDIYNSLEGRLDLSTVYRTLSAFVDSGILSETISLTQNIKFYELKQGKHQHRIICFSCGQTAPIKACPLVQLGEDYADGVEESTGYKIKGHRLELIGLCSQCK